MIAFTSLDFILFNKCLLSTVNALDTVLGSEDDRSGNKTDANRCLSGADIVVGEADNEQTQANESVLGDEW